MFQEGQYEQIIYQMLQDELDTARDQIVRTSPIDKAEASKIITKYLSDIIENGMDTLQHHSPAKPCTALMSLLSVALSSVQVKAK